MKDLILKGQYETVVSDKWISNFGESEYEKLRALQQRLHVAIRLEYKDSSPSLHIVGITKDVLTASSVIKSMVQSMEEQSKADILSNFVEWQYEDNGKYKAFDSLTNMHLESAAHQLEITIRNKSYKVDPSKQCAVDNQGRSITLRRVSKAEGKLLRHEQIDQFCPLYSLCVCLTHKHTLVHIQHFCLVKL